MNIRTVIFRLKELKNKADWNLLLFLLLFLNVKVGVKIIAVVLIYLLQFNFRFGFKLKNSRLPLFYLLIILIALISTVINKAYVIPGYPFILLCGIGFWGLCILAAHQVKLAVERNEPAVIHRTILLFFLINAAMSFFNIGLIILKTHAINPYTYQGLYQKYFMGTGDYIRGITFNTSNTNAVLSAFGVIYFLIRNNFLMVLLCMAVLLLTGSNFTNLALVFILALLFILKSSRNQKSIIVICTVFLVIFMAKVSPQNNTYVKAVFYTVSQHKPGTAKRPVPVLPIIGRPDSMLNPEEKKDKVAILYLDSIYKATEKTRLKHRPSYVTKTVMLTDGGRIKIPGDDINSASFQSLKTTPPDQRQLLEFIKMHRAELPVSAGREILPSLPGKVTGLWQTVNFFKDHPQKLVAGEGTGNFSSKLAFRISGLGINGGNHTKFDYLHPDFVSNHLDLYVNFFSKDASFHTFINTPFSVYDQLLGEYGLPGILVFLICYAGFFARHWKKLTYGVPVLMLVMGVLFIDYWFEQLSILIFFELFLFLDIKESSVTTT